MSGEQLAFEIRNAVEADLDGVMAVEAEWPEEQRAPREKFESRLERFPEGFFVVEADGGIVAVSTSTLTTYDPDDLGQFRTWEGCTNDGYLHPLGDRSDYNAYYIVSSGIRKAYRQGGIREALILSHLANAARLGLEFTVTGAMMPGYDRYCLEHGEIPGPRIRLPDARRRAARPHAEEAGLAGSGPSGRTTRHPGILREP